ncbi:[protein-PII] uridylyltransferase [Corynebacterium lizhenjunii]|uniref:[protein-PII] uridylyltransferase n=1 Tax=Corynebacterium lizhenjunii TaxID=2709394 RepID=A0A7T0KEW8_9CORY|nr:[protein-PII] uridylyltransferase [Corynebacterium lizhenjunii]QPK78438.1 [protein-PII] uridylyltransferase [Corynebacterium lizhenjunii]
MDSSPAQVRARAHAAAAAVVGQLHLPPGSALAATGSFARQEMTPHSDIDLILLVPDAGPDLADSVDGLWRPVWDAKYHLDFAVRTPQECAAIALEDSSAGFAQLDLRFIAGDRPLCEQARAALLGAWRRQIQRGFDGFIDTAIARWHRSGRVAAMTNPDLKNGRGGLRDVQLLKALALGNLCDMPDVRAHHQLLLDVRTLLHVHARRHRDTLDPEFAAEIAHDLGFNDRYQLTAAVVSAATAIERAVESGLATARAVVHRRGGRQAPRRPLDIDVIDAGGSIMLSRRPDLSDPWLLTRVAAASARTGLPIAQATWEQLCALPAPTQLWPRAAVDDFFSILSSPEHTGRVIGELDAHGLWERLVPDWGPIRGLLPRERTHTHSVDHHCINTVIRCAQRRTEVARPDLLLLAALFHDMGKGYGRPHAQVGAELVTRQAARMRLNLADRSRVQTIVAEHTTLARLAARLDPASDAARDAVLDAAQYDPLTITLLRVLAKADAQATGPGVWTRGMEAAMEQMCQRALEFLRPVIPVRPHVVAPEDIGLRMDWEHQQLTVYWRGSYQRELVRPLALIAAMGWTVVGSRLVAGPHGTFRGEFDIRTVQQSLADAADAARLAQSYASGTYSVLPPIAPEPTTAVFDRGGILVVRTVERVAALGHLLGALPDVEWVRHEVLGATMIVHVQFRGEYERVAIVQAVMRALAGGSGAGSPVGPGSLR